MRPELNGKPTSHYLNDLRYMFIYPSRANKLMLATLSMIYESKLFSSQISSQMVDGKENLEMQCLPIFMKLYEISVPSSGILGSHAW